MDGGREERAGGKVLPYLRAYDFTRRVCWWERCAARVANVDVDIEIYRGGSLPLSERCKRPLRSRFQLRDSKATCSGRTFAKHACYVCTRNLQIPSDVIIGASLPTGIQTLSKASSLCFSIHFHFQKSTNKWALKPAPPSEQHPLSYTLFVILFSGCLFSTFLSCSFAQNPNLLIDVTAVNQ